MSQNRGRLLLGNRASLSINQRKKAKPKEIIVSAENSLDLDNPRFAIEIFRFTREYAISLDYDRACEVANFSFTKGLKPKEKESLLDSMRRELLEYAQPYIDKQLNDLKATLEISPAKILLELQKIATYDILKQENFLGSLENPRLIVNMEHKLKALSMLGRYLGLFEKDNLQRYNGLNISIDNSTNKTEIETLEIENKQINVNFINSAEDIIENKDE